MMLNILLGAAQTKTILALLCLILVSYANFCSAEIVMDDKELAQDEIQSTKPLIGFRTIPSEIFMAPNEGRGPGIPVDMFMASAAATPEVKATLQMRGKDPNNAGLDDWWGASRSATPHLLGKWPRAAVGKWLLAGEVISYDPTLIAALADTELFPSKRPVTYAAYVSDKKIKWVQADLQVWNSMAAYGSLTSESPGSIWASDTRFAQTQNTIQTYSKLRQVVQLEAAYVSFGKPVPYWSKELKLEIPRDIASRGDVFGVLLAVSLRQFKAIKATDVEELTFAVTVSHPEVVALDLIPLRYDKASSAKSGAVTLGKTYGTEVIYASLKPTVIANGVQESRFSWSLYGDAIDTGCRRFMAILLVPKGTKSIAVKQSVRLIVNRWYLPSVTEFYAEDAGTISTSKHQEGPR